MAVHSRKDSRGATIVDGPVTSRFGDPDARSRAADDHRGSPHRMARCRAYRRGGPPRQDRRASGSGCREGGHGSGECDRGSREGSPPGGHACRGVGTEDRRRGARDGRNRRLPTSPSPSPRLRWPTSARHRPTTPTAGPATTQPSERRAGPSLLFATPSLLNPRTSSGRRYEGAGATAQRAMSDGRSICRRGRYQAID